MAPKILPGEKYFELCFQLLKTGDLGKFEKFQQVYLNEEEGEAISAIRNSVVNDAENLGLAPVHEANFAKESTMDQELDICNRVYEIATYNMRRVCVTIKKYFVNKSSYIQIRLFTAKANEDLTQVAYVNYTLNELKELTQILGDFMFVDNYKPQFCFVMFCMFVI